MEKKAGKPPKPLRLLINLFSKTKGGGKGGNSGGAKNDNGGAAADNAIARGARDRNDNGECGHRTVQQQVWHFRRKNRGLRQRSPRWIGWAAQITSREIQSTLLSHVQLY